MEIVQPFNPQQATAQISALAKTYRCTEIVGDKYATQWSVEAFRQSGIRYKVSERGRSAIYLDGFPLFTTGRARFDNDRLIRQFTRLSARSSAQAVTAGTTAPMVTTDLCNSAAGALAWLLRGRGDPTACFSYRFAGSAPRPLTTPRWSACNSAKFVRFGRI